MSEQAGQFVNSASEDRTANNTMRHQYRVLSDDEKELARLVQDFIDANYPFHQRTLILELAKEVDRGA